MPYVLKDISIPAYKHEMNQLHLNAEIDRIPVPSWL